MNPFQKIFTAPTISPSAATGSERGIKFRVVVISTIIKTLVADSGKKGKGIEPRGGGRDRLTQQHEVRVLSTYRCSVCCVLARRKLNSIKKA